MDFRGREMDLDEERYKFFLNGKLYGRGDAEYMVELFQDYVQHCDMYGFNHTDVVIKRVHKNKINWDAVSMADWFNTKGAENEI